jgi:hypothetical protein
MRFLALTCLGIIFVATAAAQSSSRPSIDSQDPPDANPQYFPPGIFSDRTDYSDVMARSWAKNLRAWGEPSLLGAAKDKLQAEYRLLSSSPWHGMCSFAIRLTILPNGSGRITSVAMANTDINGRCASGSPRTAEVSRDDVTKFQALLGKAAFWTMPSRGPKPEPDLSTLILEGTQDGHYHAVVRMGSKDESYRAACDYLEKLAGINAGLTHAY